MTININKNILDKILLLIAVISFFFNVTINLYLLYHVYYYDNSILLSLLFYFLFEYKFLKNKFNTIYDYSEERYNNEYFRSLNLLLNYFYFYYVFNIELINELNIYHLIIGTLVNLIYAKYN